MKGYDGKANYGKAMLCLLLGVCLLVNLAGCSSEAKENTTEHKIGDTSLSSDVTSGNIDNGNLAIGEDGTGSSLKIAIVSSPSGVDDRSFNQDNYNGILAFLNHREEATVKAIKEESGDPAAAVQAVADIAADYDVVVCCGFQFAGIGTLAQDNPDTKFILVDAYPVDDGGSEIVCENVYAMTFAEQEGGFFAGMAAALTSDTKKVAVVTGIAYPSNVNYQYGFESGVYYANAKYQTEVKLVEIPSYAGKGVDGKEVGGNYIGSFSDEATGKVVGKALIDQGADRIFVAAGASGNGVFTAVKEAKGVMVIGSDVDQYEDGANGSNNVVLTSVLKVMHRNVQEQLEKIAEGQFQGKNERLMADTDSVTFVSESGRHQLPGEVIQILEETYPLVQNKTIMPASSGGYSSEDFPGLK